MVENKVRFNLKNVHYAVLTPGATPSWGAPKPVPGAVTLTMNPQGEMTTFYADGVVYYQSSANNGYSGDLEMAKFPDQMLQDVWKFSLGSTSKVLTENSNSEPAAFALLYQIDGDADKEYYLLYCCTGTRPGIGSTTNQTGKTPQTQSSTISAVAMADGIVMARTTAETPEATKSAWFSSVFRETAGG